VPAANLVPLPQSVSLRQGTLLEPITVVLHPLMMLENQLGRLETAVVTGLGTIGLLAVQVLRFMGARNIVAADIIQDKVDTAIELGATHGVNVAQEKLEDVTDDLGGANLVFEASGTVPAKRSAVRAAASRGEVLLVGTSPAEVAFDGALFERISRKEIVLRGSWMNYSPPWPGPEWTTAAWLLEHGHITDSAIFTHEYPLSRGTEAFDLIRDEAEPYVKVLLAVQPEQS
jgi:threonine dehydrogenase-like Zn-dependent dehydrogenase